MRQLEYLPWSGRVEMLDTYFLRQAEAWRDGGPPGNLRWAPWYTANGTQPQNAVLAAVVPTYVCPLDELTHRPQTGFY